MKDGKEKFYYYLIASNDKHNRPEVIAKSDCKMAVECLVGESLEDIAEYAKQRILNGVE